MGVAITFDELILRLRDMDNVLIITHKRPDPDTLGSGLGLKYILNKLGKKAFIACSDKISEKLCRIFKVSPELDGTSCVDCSHIISVDSATSELIGHYSKERIELVIDHHYSNTLYGEENYIDSTSAACGEIILRIASALGVSSDRTLAEYLYCAISTDCGSFQYSNTTPATMTAAAQLISTGIDFPSLCRMLYEEKTHKQLSVERLAYSALELHMDGKIATICVTNEMKRASGLDDEDFIGLSGIPRLIKDVLVGITLKQNEDDAQESYRVSLRANCDIDVSKVAARFGGGGHIRASGCTVKGDKKTASDTIISAVSAAIEEYERNT
ncbi:MAG: bifunctional oligoribonuclease/PAP phosphatase NrnA [Eubacteriales bacterium]